MKLTQGDVIAGSITNLVREIVHDMVTYPESGNRMQMRRAEDDLAQLLDKFQAGEL